MRRPAATADSVGIFQEGDAMIKNMRCSGCGRKRKKSHEKRVNTSRAVSPGCMTLDANQRKIHNDKIFGRDK